MAQSDTEAAESTESPQRTPAAARWGCMLVLLLLVGAAVGGLVYYNRSHAQQMAKRSAEARGPRAVPVKVARVESRNMPEQLQVVGNALSSRTVAVTSQVSGEILHVFFNEGDYVRKGQPLFEIDPRPLQEDLNKARATVSKDRAQLHQARLTVVRDHILVRQAISNLDKDVAQVHYAETEDRRYGILASQGAVTDEQSEQMHANALSLQATVRSDRSGVSSAQAALEVDAANLKVLAATLRADQAAAANARVQLSYTRINSPMEGRTGNLQLYPGAVVQANASTPMVTINQIRPIFVSFAVPERYLVEIQTLQAHHALGVLARLPGQSGPAERGRVDFINNTVDPNTGTITLRATFPNRSRNLWPGHYVNVTLELATQHNAVVVPETAVQPGQQGDYVFVVGKEMKAQTRSVKVARTESGLSVISSGLSPGETVVTDGQLQLVSGTLVSIDSGRKPAGKTSSRTRHGPGRQPG